MQHAEAAHAAGDTGGFDTFQALLEGNELGSGTRHPQRKQKPKRMRVRDAQSDEDGSDSDGGHVVEEGLREALEDGDSEDEVDLYAAMDSEEEPGAPAGTGFMDQLASLVLPLCRSSECCFIVVLILICICGLLIDTCYIHIQPGEDFFLCCCCAIRVVADASSLLACFFFRRSCTSSPVWL